MDFSTQLSLHHPSQTPFFLTSFHPLTLTTFMLPYCLLFSVWLPLADCGLLFFIIHPNQWDETNEPTGVLLTITFYFKAEEFNDCGYLNESARSFPFFDSSFGCITQDTTGKVLSSSFLVYLMI